MSVPITEYLNKGFKVKAQTAVQLSSAQPGETIYISIPLVPNYFSLSRVAVTAVEDGVTGQMTVLILNDPAGYRAASTNAGHDDCVSFAWPNESGNGAPSSTWKLEDAYDEGPTVTDNSFSGCIHFAFVNVSLNKNTAFKIEVQGNALEDTDASVYLNWRYYNRRMVTWVYDNTNARYIDYTNRMIQPVQLNAAQLLNDTSGNGNYIYLGAYSPFNRAMFQIGTGTSKVSNVVLSAQYYCTDGTWKNLTGVLDNTNPAIIHFDTTEVDNPFGQSGAIRWTDPGNWGRIAMPDNLIAPPPDPQERVWVRLGLASTPTSWPTFYQATIVTNTPTIT